MSLFLASLNSGSNGNCYYVGNEKEAVLIDAGISCREIEKRLKRLELSVAKVKAVFISHEHSDHIRGVQVFSRKYKLPVYITPATLHNSGMMLDDQLINAFKPYKQVIIGDLQITAFPKLHDAADPHSFVVSGSGVNVGVLTDIGFACEHVIHHFKQCHAVFLESNYCETMLEEGQYPFYLKRRIAANTGHLSNHQALQLFLEHKNDDLRLLLLSHLSRENNSPQLVNNMFSEQAKGVKVVVASRDYESEVFEVSNGSVHQVIENNIVAEEKLTQMSLF